jgi:hypothetical protein
LFTPHFAVSIDYARVPVFQLVGGGTTSDHANVWTLALHFPFNYGDYVQKCPRLVVSGQQGSNQTALNVRTFPMAAAH